MTPTLTDDQINQLYRYVANQGVSYYDVQVELVDHIATEIERQIEQNPEQPTEHIFDKILTKFRYYDFEGLEKQKKKQVQRQYRRFFWRSFTSFFTLPKVVFMVGTTWIMFELFRTGNFPQYIQKYALGFTVVTGFLYIGLVIYRKAMMQKKLSHSVYLMVGAFTLSNAGNVLKLIIEYTMFGTSTYPLVAAILSVLWLVAIWVQIDSSEKLIAHGRKLYPQAFGLKAT